MSIYRPTLNDKQTGSAPQTKQKSRKHNRRQSRIENLEHRHLLAVDLLHSEIVSTLTDGNERIEELCVPAQGKSSSVMDFSDVADISHLYDSLSLENSVATVLPKGVQPASETILAFKGSEIDDDSGEPSMSLMSGLPQLSFYKTADTLEPLFSNSGGGVSNVLDRGAIEVHYYSDDSGGSPTLSIPMKLGTAGDAATPGEDFTLQWRSQEVTIDSNGEFMLEYDISSSSEILYIIPKSDELLEGSEVVYVEFPESPTEYTYNTARTFDVAIYDANFSAIVTDTTSSSQIGNRLPLSYGSCGCETNILHDQSGKIILSFEVEINTSTISFDYLGMTDYIYVTGSITGADEVVSQEISAWQYFERSYNSEPTILKFAFEYDSHIFGSVEHVHYKADVTSSPLSVPGGYMQLLVEPNEGDYSVNGTVAYGKTGVTIDSGPKLEITDEGVLVGWGGQGDYYAKPGSTYESAPGAFSTLTEITGGYQLIDRANSVYVFDSEGYALSKTDSRGRVTTYDYIVYEDEKLLSKIESPFITETFSYSENRLIYASNTLGDWIHLEYTSSKMLSIVTQNDPDGEGPLSELVTTYHYDYNDRLIEVVRPGGLVTEYTYDSTGRLASVISPEGSQTTYVSPQQAAVSGGSAIGTVTDNSGISTQYSYDNLGNVIREVDAEGNITLYDRDENGLVLIKTLPVLDEEEPEEVLIYQYTYDTRGNRLTETLPDESVRTWVYHATWNQPIQYTDANGNITLYEYDATHELLLSETKVIGEIDDITTAYTYTPAPTVSTDPPAGLVASITAPNGVKTEYEYNAKGNRTKIIYAVGTADEAEVTMTYDSVGNMLTRTDELGRVTTNVYDDLNRLIETTSPDPDGAGPLDAKVTTYTYNEQGKRSAVTVNGRTTEYEYNSKGQLIKTIQPDPDGEGPLAAPETTHTYHSDGNLATTTDPLGNVTTYTYTNGLLTSVTEPDPDGAGPQSAPVTTYTYDDAGRVLTTTNALGQTTTYEYDNLGRLVSTTYPDPDSVGPLEALTATTEYDFAGRVFSQTDIHGVTTTFTYDSEGRRLSQTTPLGTTTFEYDELGRVVREETEDPDGAGPLSALVTLYVYTAAGQIASVTTPSGTTTYEYDNRGRQISVTRPDPAGLDPQNGPTTSYTYDAVGNRLTETDPLGNVTTYVYDNLNRVIEITAPDPDGAGPALSQVTTFTYDVYGNRESVEYSADYSVHYVYDELNRVIEVTEVGGLESRTVYYEYDAKGQLIGEVDVLGNETTYEYDNLGRRISVTLPDPDATGPLTSPVMTYEYNALGQILSSTDPLGRVTTYTYDDMGRQLTVTLPDPDDTGPLDAPVSTNTYGANGRLVSVEDFEDQTVSYTYTASGQIATLTDPRGVTTYTYDALGRTINITEPDPDGAGPLAAPFTDNVFDDEGRLIEVTTLDGTTSYEYDQLGRTTKVTQPDPGSGDAPWTTFTYDLAGNRLTESNRLGHTTQYKYDNVGQLVKKIDAELGETTYAYDELGNRLSLTDPVGNTTSWAYDGFSRMILETNELEDERHYAYDLAGNILEYTDRNGRITEYAYDNLQRRIGETWLDGVTPVHTLEYAYDAASQLTSAGDSHADYTFTYDNLGRVTSTEHDLDALGFSVTLDQAYDALGRRISLAAEIDETADLINHYQYDYLNRMTQVTQSGQSGGNAVAEKRVDFAYDPLHDYRYESITRYADLSGTKMVAATQYSYDANSRLVALTHSDSLSATLAGYTWAYDHAGRLTEFTVAGYSGENATYTYDDTDQLVGVDRDGTTNDESYTYDENGNRIGGGYTVGDNNQLLSDGIFNYTYDAEGNRTLKENISTGETVEYVWDHRNRLIEIITKDDLSVVIHEVAYTYDVFNHRIVKTIDADGVGSATATQEIFVYDGLREQRGNAGDHILLIFDEKGDLTTRTLYGPDVDQILATEDVDELFADGDVLWALTDHQGSVRDIAEHDTTTGITSILNHIVYDAFGQITAESDPTVVFFVAFTGRERDLESDLQYNRFRYYDAAIGRWMSEDPIGFDAGDANLVRYVGNGVTYLTDPSGLWEKVEGRDHEWRAEKGDTYLSLVRIIEKEDGKKPHVHGRYKLRDENVMGIIPVPRTATEAVIKAYDQNEGNDATPVAGACYDTRSITIDALTSKSIIVSVGKDMDVQRAPNGDPYNNNYTKLAREFYRISSKSPKLAPEFFEKFANAAVESRANGSDVVDFLATQSGNGSTPISAAVIIGHSWKRKDGIGNLNPAHGYFSSTDLKKDYDAIFQWTKYKDTLDRNLSPAFWFTPNSSIRLTGCYTTFFAASLSSELNRSTQAVVYGTSMPTWALPDGTLGFATKKKPNQFLPRQWTFDTGVGPSNNADHYHKVTGKWNSHFAW